MCNKYFKIKTVCKIKKTKTNNVFIEVGQVSFVVGQVIFTFQPVLGQVPEKSICRPLVLE